MSLHHFPHIHKGKWHAVYPVVGTTILSSIGEANTKKGAQFMCEQANKDQLLKEKAALQAAIHPADRKIPTGFYSNDDAQSTLF